MFLVEELRRVTSALYVILKRHECLQDFRTLFSEDRIDSRGRKANIKNITILADGPTTATEVGGNYNYDTRKESRVHFIDFTISSLKIFLDYYHEEEMLYASHKKYFTIAQTGGTRKIINAALNVDKTFKTKGTSLNLVQALPVLFSNGYSNSRLTQVYLVGNKNALAGFSTSDGHLYIRQQFLKNILKYATDEDLVRILTRLLLHFQRFFSFYIDTNVKSLEENVQDKVLLEVVYPSLVSDFSMFPEVPPDADIQRIDLIDKTIKKQIKSYVSNLLKGTAFGINDAYSYARLVKEILKTQKDREKRIQEQAFHEGMSFGTKIEMLGWRPSRDPRFVDASSVDHTCMWWSKDITIIPDKFICNSKLYQIPEKHKKKWKITKLYLNQRGEMRCEGNHPNVSGSRVCTGDLRIDWSNYEELKKSLERAESLLDMINYDSCYDRSMRDIMLETAVEVDKPSKVIKKDIRTIKELDGNFQYSSGGEEEVITTEEKKKKSLVKEVVSDNIVIARVESNPEYRAETAGTNERVDQRVEFGFDNAPQETAPNLVYAIEQVAQQSAYVVQSDGQLVQEVRSELPTPVMIVPVPIVQESLVLGDANILR